MFNTAPSGWLSGSLPGVVNGPMSHDDEDDGISGLSVPLIEGGGASSDGMADGDKHLSTPLQEPLTHTDADRWQAMRSGAGGGGASASTARGGGGGRATSNPTRIAVPTTIQEGSSSREGGTASKSLKHQQQQGNVVIAHDYNHHPVPPLQLLDLNSTESIFKVCTGAAVSLYLFLLAFGYSMIPTEDLVRLDGVEQQVTATAAVVFVVSILLTLLPMVFRKQPVSAVVLCGLLIQFVALTTNTLLAFAPTIVIRDPVTHARVFYVRWCEW
jgi:hypothetical protein